MSASVSRVVLDASALLAYLFGEVGADVVAEAMATGACMSAVNFSEVMSKLADRGVHVDQATDDFSERGLADAIGIIDFDLSEALEAARFRESTRNMGLSFGGRACLALARSRGIPVLTADRQWLSVQALEVRLIR